ncbi:hypothetical protein Mpe_A0813 [Methylibium petroleiphilum PM1]|uniref:Uncharacterized protein n=1 Tax=Methylibium petroleiphilum (strain ATCC BAA-1232 / LMG 22953 / PM1) TaxID=420662 RepID=A2SDY6_METPP|nr:hypothetical protein Mpe_A0813 [Methylibium petroleiphilum PM1]
MLIPPAPTVEKNLSFAARFCTRRHGAGSVEGMTIRMSPVPALVLCASSPARHDVLLLLDLERSLCAPRSGRHCTLVYGVRRLRAFAGQAPRHRQFESPSAAERTPSENPPQASNVFQ